MPDDPEPYDIGQPFDVAGRKAQLGMQPFDDGPAMVVKDNLADHTHGA